MILKHINQTVCAGAIVLLGAVSVASCTDKNDWGVDASHDRLFHPTTLTVTPQDDRATVTFSKMPDADYYVVEYSTDSLYDAIPMGGTAHSVVDSSFTSSPDTIYNLEGTTKYFLRIMSRNKAGKASTWKYLDDYSFKTKSEQIFKALDAADVDENSIRVSWKSGAKVTNIVVLQNGEEQQNITLTDEQKAAASYTVTGLKPTTTYTINILNGENKRGSLTATTAAAMPAADYKVTLSPDVKELSQTLIDEIAAKAKEKAGSTTNYSATIAIPAGVTLDVHGIGDDGNPASLTIPDGMSVTFFGLSGGEAPTLSLTKNFDLAGSHA